MNDLGGMDITLVALVVPNWSATPQDWICLCKTSCALRNVDFHNNHVLFLGGLFSHLLILGIKAWACSMDVLAMATRAELGTGHQFPNDRRRSEERRRSFGN